MASRYVSGEIDMDDINAFFSLGNPLNTLKTIKRQAPSTVIHSQTRLPIEPVNNAFDRLCVNQRQAREYDDTYGDRLKEEEVQQLLGISPEDEPSGMTSSGYCEDGSLLRGAAGGGLDQSVRLEPERRRRPADLDSLTMSTTSIQSRSMPIRTPEQDKNICRAYDLERIQDNMCRNGLPIDNFENRIVNVIDSNPVVVIKGQTGSGKTTRLPLMILNHWRETKGRLPNIIVTQPRKIAAVSVCRRVCEEQGWIPGKICGYQVSLDRCATEDTCILYCTTGILLQKLIQDKNLREFSHIVLDEVHDRESDMDFCILVIKQLLKSVSSQVRIVLMSATLDTEIFCHYFSLPVGRSPIRLEPAPMLEVEGRPFEVKDFYADDFAKALNCHLPRTSKDDARLTLEARNLGVKLIHYFDRREEKEETNRDAGDADRPGRKYHKGAVLCFLPGLPEIESFNDDLAASQTEECCFQLIQLHSAISLSRQETIFKKPEKGIRKVILATNIAESSITVPDVKYVVDFCMTKRLHCDTDNNLQHLKVEWTSKNSAKQRRGRAGRVSDGVCYRLVEQKFYQESLDEQEVPEMKRASLSQLVLKAKRLNLYPPKKLLSLAMDHPGLEKIERAVLELKELEALTSHVSRDGIRGYEAADLTQDDLDEAFDGDLTFVGLVMADIPLDVHLTKLILMGHVFGLLDEAIIMACSLNQQSLFLREFDYRRQLMTFFIQIAFSMGTESDMLAALNAYRCWKDVDSKSGFTSRRHERKWEQEQGLDMRRLRDVDKQIEEVKRRLERFNLRAESASSLFTTEGSTERLVTRDFFLKLIVAAAFYPNYFVRHSMDNQGETLRYKQKDMNNHDPHTTVYLRGFNESLGPLYEGEIRRFFHDQLGADVMKLYSMEISFEGTKAFVEFAEKMPTETNRDRALPPVLVSLKLEQIISTWRGGIKSNPINKYRLLTLRDARAHLDQVEADIKAGRYEGKKVDPHYPQCRVEPPPPTRSLMAILVTWVVSPAQFWGIHFDIATQRLTQEIYARCNDDTIIRHPVDRASFRSKSNSLCLARWFDVNGGGDERFYRAVILPRDPLDDDRDKDSVRTFFVDYGNEVELRWSEIFYLPDDALARHKHQAMEFCLKGIKPNPAKYFEGWPSRGGSPSNVTDRTVNALEGKPNVFVQVFSVLRGVVRCSVFLPPPAPSQSQRQMPTKNVNFNEELIECGHAVEVAESLESVKNHDFRECSRREDEARRSYAEQKARMKAEIDFYGTIPEASSLACDMDPSLLTDVAQKKLLEARRAVAAMEKVEGNLDANWENVNNSGGGRYPCKNRQGLFQGPYSSYTYDFSSLTVSGGACGPVKISEDSVNCVAIDGAAEEQHQRLMVAAGVSLNSTGNTIRTRGTTIMPNILGLPSLLTLLFAPQVEFQTDRGKNAMLGARCGLGWYFNCRQERVPLYPDHDTELAFDVEINVDDVRDVNTLRLLIYNALDGDVESESLKKSHFEMKKSQEKIRSEIKALLLKPRRPAASDRQIEWRPWGFNQDLSLTVPLTENILPGQRVQLLSAICPEAASLTTTTTAAVAATTTTGRSHGRGLRLAGDGATDRFNDDGRAVGRKDFGSRHHPRNDGACDPETNVKNGQPRGSHRPNFDRRTRPERGQSSSPFDDQPHRDQRELYSNVRSFLG